MKNLLLIPVLFLSLSFSVFAQKASEGTEKSPLGDGNAIVITLEAQEKNVQEVMDDRFSKLKDKKEKGFKTYKGQVFAEISPDMLDYYWKVENKKDNETKIIFFISKGYDNFLNSRENPQEVGAAIKFLDKLVSEVRRYELQKAIDEQTKVVEENAKKQEDLQKEADDLVKEKEKLEKELEDNKNDLEENKKSQEDQKNRLEDEKKTLTELQKKLNSVK